MTELYVIKYEDKYLSPGHSPVKDIEDARFYTNVAAAKGVITRIKNWWKDMNNPHYQIVRVTVVEETVVHSDY